MVTKISATKTENLAFGHFNLSLPAQNQKKVLFLFGDQGSGVRKQTGE
jgi:hypothetical protein